MSIRGPVAATLAILVIGAGAAWFLGAAPSTGDAPGGAAAGRRDPAAEPDPPASGARLLSFEFEEGLLLAWTIALESDGRFDPAFLRSSALGRGGAPTTPSLVEVSSRLTGALHARFLRDREGDWWIAARLSGDFLVDGALTADGDLLDRVFLARTDASGRVDRFRFAEGLPEAIAGACRAVLEEMETVLPGNTALEWTSRTEDLHGEAEVHHRLLPGGSPPGFVVESSKTRYLSLAPTFPSVEEPAARILRSTGTARRSQGFPWLSSIDRKEEVRLLSRDRAFGESRTRFSASECPPDPSSGPPSDFAEALASLRDPALLRRSILRRRPDLDALNAHRDSATAAEAFTASFAGDYAAARDLLLHWLRQDPDRAAALALWLEREGARLDLDPELALWGMIARAGTPESQSALAEVLLGEGWSERSRFRALAHAGDPPLPTREYTDALWEVHRRNAATAGELGRTLHASSAFALGALGGPDRPDREASSRLGGEIAAALDAASTVGDREILLDAAGNHGGPEVLGSLERVLDSPDPAMRARAFRAFRRMEGPEAVETLLRWWRREPVPFVRAAAMETLSEMPPSEASLSFARAAVADPLPEAECVPLVGLLGRTLKEHQGHVEILRALLARRPAQAVRKEIYRFVLPE